MKNNRASEVKVGIFITVVMVLLVFVILTMSSKSSLFKSTSELHTSFGNIMGLTEGAEVRLSGVDIGLVKRIRFSDKTGDTSVFVDMSIDTDAMPRIPMDSLATIDTLGLLGKKYIEIIPGNPEKTPVHEHDIIESHDPKAMLAPLTELGESTGDLKKVLANLDAISASIKGGQGVPPTDLSKAISGLENMINEVKAGNGILHTLIYDQTKSKIISDMAQSVATLKQVVDDIKHGQGTLHELIYSDKGERMIANLTDTSEDIRQIVGTVRTQPGALHSLIYDPDKAQIIEDLKVTSADLRLAADKIARGEGSLGALIVDPTIYEDIKKITGGLERSQVFKSVVRTVIRRYEQVPELEPE
ncbi:MAG: MlaD family protein [Candidatus Alcyoniella australis]|nr:MlaD family protein [Candidatus Alcyoniella australis]